MVLAIINII